MGNNLTRRVQDANNGGNTGKEVELQRHLGAQITKMKEQFQVAMPKGMEAAQLIRDALTALRTQRNLPQCDELSVLGRLMTFAQLGLRPHVPSLGHGWLLPFWDKHSGGFKAQIVIGYKGYAALAHRTGTIASLVGREVRQQDFFDVEYGLDERLAHKPARPGPRGEVTDYYTIVKYIGGGATFWHMSKVECEEHRDLYAMAKKDGKIVGPWRDHFDAMAIKTTFLKLARWMPKSTELEAAIAADESVRYDLSGDSLDSLFHGEKANGEFVDGEVIPGGPDGDQTGTAARPEQPDESATSGDAK
jgi:recombination protein RecT